MPDGRYWARTSDLLLVRPERSASVCHGLPADYCEADPRGLRAVAGDIGRHQRRAVAAGLELPLPDPPGEPHRVGPLLRLPACQLHRREVSSTALLESLPRLDAALALTATGRLARDGDVCARRLRQRE